MKKLQITDILTEGAVLVAKELNAGDKEVQRLIEETKQKQAEVLKLGQIDQERLRLVVQL